MTGSLEGSVILVTGGGRGLGRGLVTSFASAGATVVACGRKPPAVPLPGEFEVCDVRDADAVAALVKGIADRHGRLDGAVNNAGGAPYAPAAEMSPRLFERVVALNLVAPFYVAQCANAIMQTQPEGGAIINIGSAVARRPSPNAAPYNASKAGLLGLTRSLALEWAPLVRVNSVSVGLLETESVRDTYGEDVAAVAATVPMGRLARGEDVAAVCMALLARDLSYVTGADLMVDGGGEQPSFLSAVKGR